MAGESLSGWALVLGASSGFGRATALELARRGMDIFGVHLDRRGTLPQVEEVVAGIRAAGRRAEFFNVNAADPEKRGEVVRTIREVAGPAGGVRVMLHSLAFGSLLPYVPDDPQAAVTAPKMDMTLDVMAHSLVYWTQELLWAGLLRPGARIFAMTSAGSTRVWTSYGPVSAAKAALEAHMRQLAVELAPRGVTVNALRAGVTDTPALRKIPGHEEMLAAARRRNPSGRLTTPEDIARAVAALAAPETAWITGNVIGVDGGEELAG